MAIINASLPIEAAAKAVVILFDCDASANVLDIVRPSNLINNKVISVNSNTDLLRPFGIIIDKPNAEKAKVLVIGIVSGFSGLQKGSHLFLSNTGTITQTRPTSGYLQNLGHATSDTEIYFFADQSRVKLI